MDDLKPEYENPNLPYERKSELPNLFNQRKEKVNQLSKGFEVLDIEKFEEGKFPRKLFLVKNKKN